MYSYGTLWLVFRDNKAPERMHGQKDDACMPEVIPMSTLLAPQCNGRQLDMCGLQEI